ncbi:MAG: hypothetical protein J6N72_04645, partial [Psychrobacter sp.]|nr:hypothetical protein [Psychrobacter sp.]
MKSHHQVALSLLTLCISQQLYAQTDVDASTADSVENAAISDVPSTTLDTITVTARAKTGTALAQKISEMP